MERQESGVRNPECRIRNPFNVTCWSILYSFVQFEWHMWRERKYVKKNYRSEFLQSGFIFVIYLVKEVYRKIMSEIHFVGKTQNEDLTETGS